MIHFPEKHITMLYRGNIQRKRLRWIEWKVFLREREIMEIAGAVCKYTRVSVCVLSFKAHTLTRPTSKCHPMAIFP